MASYDKYLTNYTADQYANLIKNKTSAGIALDDQQAANDFQRDNPSLFSSAAGTGSSSAASSLANLRQTYNGGVASSAPAGTVGVRAYLSNLGYDTSGLGYDQGSGQVQENNAALTPAANINGSTYATPSNVLAFAKSAGLKNTKEQQITDLIKSYTDKLNNSGTYDVYSDPSYTAAKTLVEKQAKSSIADSMEALNARGIVNSSITGNETEKINDSAAQQLAAMIPSLQQNYQTNNNNSLSQIMTLANLLQNQQNAEQSTVNTDYANETNAANTEYDNALKRADLFGYVTTDADAATLGVPKGTSTSDAAYKTASLAAKSGLTPSETLAQTKYQTQVDNDSAYGTILAYQDQYKSTTDFKADLIRHANDLIDSMGSENYNKLLSTIDAEEKANGGEPVTNSRYKSGTVWKDSKGKTYYSPIAMALSSNFSNPSSGSVSSWVNQAVKATGVGDSWAQPLAWIIQHESSGDPTAKNSKSGAYGLMQFMPSTMKKYGITASSSPAQQVAAGIQYIKDRYGTVQNAQSFWQKNGWY